MVKRFFTPHKVFYLLLLIGVLTRLFLVVKLPIWHDEAFTIWLSEHSWRQIFSGVLEPVHPPGYYLFIKLCMQVSKHLYWLRLSSVIAFLLSAIILKKLADKIKKPNFSFILMVMYSFSGYFLIFDWQVRMYSVVVTLILLSLYMFRLLYVRGIQTARIVLFTLVNFFGLYIDFAYLWYLIPFGILMFFMAFTKKSGIYLRIMFSILTSMASFLVIYPSVLFTYSRGIGGIEWAKPYLAPSFFLPYFFGTHLNIIMTLFFLGLCLGGIWYWYKSKIKNLFLYTLLFSALFSLVSTIVYSYFFTTIFHLRSLQVVPLAIVFLTAFITSELSVKTHKLFLPMFCLVILVNGLTVVRTIQVYPGRYLLQFFNWKHVINYNYDSSIKNVKYKVNDNLPTPILLWGLKYTLSGMESYHVYKINYSEANSQIHSDCTGFYKGYIDLYKCD